MNKSPFVKDHWTDEENSVIAQIFKEAKNHTKPSHDTLILIGKLQDSMSIMAKQVGDIIYHFGDDGMIRSIEKQGIKTNGKVTILEKFMWTMSGAIIIIGIFVTPLFIDMVRSNQNDGLKASLSSLENSIKEINK